MALINKEQEYQDQENWSDSIEKLKGYKEFAEKVEYWAKQKDGSGDLVIDGSYEIIWDNELEWCVDVNGDVSFYSSNIKEIPFQFRNVSNVFSCYYCEKLTSLKNCPIYVGGYFDCNKCSKLTSLKGCPVYVGGYFDCGKCSSLSSLEGCPKEVDRGFFCSACNKEFTEEYVRSLCNVKGDIDN